MITIIDPRSADQVIVTFEDIIMYPNPAHNLLTLESRLEIINYKISNMSGKAMLTGDITNNTLDVSTLRSGIYVVVLTDDQGATHTLKFIKQ